MVMYSAAHMGSRCKYDIGINAFDSMITVECANSEIRDALDRYLFPPVPRIESFSSAPDIRICIECIDDGFRVMLNDDMVASAIAVHDAVRAAIKSLDDILIHRMKAFRAVHAGAVLIEGRVVLLPGSTHAGKSSLVAEFLRHGATYYSDEYALIDECGLVHSYPRPLLLRSEGVLQSLVLPSELNSAFAVAPAPVGWILALEFAPDNAWDIREISQAEAAMLLLRNTPHEMAQSPEMVDFFFRVVAEAACYEGSRGDAADAVAHFLHLTVQK